MAWSGSIGMFSNAHDHVDVAREFLQRPDASYEH
jgi:hypothetical protein